MEHVNTSITSVKSLLIHTAPENQAVLTPNPYGYPLLVQLHPILLRGIYIDPTDDLELAIQHAQNRLENNREHLLAIIPPYRETREISVRIFVFDKEMKVSLPGSLHDRPVTRYVSPQQSSGYAWVSDWQQGKTGYFLTGHSATANLWKIARIDIDAFNSVILVLSPMRLLTGLPNLKFANISDPIVRNEIETHYTELQKAIASHSYRALITHARSIIEAALGLCLAKNGHQPGKDLNDHLQAVKTLRLKAKSELGWFSDLAYHAAQKIRLLHARTHIDRTVKQGRPVQPELALSCIEDLKEILQETKITDL